MKRRYALNETIWSSHSIEEENYMCTRANESIIASASSSIRSKESESSMRGARGESSRRGDEMREEKQGQDCERKRKEMRWKFKVIFAINAIALLDWFYWYANFMVFVFPLLFFLYLSYGYASFRRTISSFLPLLLGFFLQPASSSTQPAMGLFKKIDSVGIIIWHIWNQIDSPLFFITELLILWFTFSFSSPPKSLSLGVFFL